MTAVRLDDIRFLAAVDALPLVSIDLLIVRGGDDVLLGLRNNRPAQGSWFVPGGRINKNERLLAALARIVEEELGLGWAMADGALQPMPLGVFEHFYDDCFAGAVDVSTHYVVLAYGIEVAADFALPVCDAQHAALRWWPLAEAQASAQVHALTRDYLRDVRTNEFLKIEKAATP